MKRIFVIVSVIAIVATTFTSCKLITSVFTRITYGKQLTEEEKQELLYRAEEGDSVVQYKIAENDDFDRKTRELNFQKSLDSGYEWAINDRAKFAMSEGNTAKTRAEYIKWHQYGVEKGSTYMTHKLAEMYLKGEFVKKDTLRAMELLRINVERYHADSRILLRKLTGEKIPALRDFYEEMRDRYYSENGTPPAKIIYAGSGARGALMRTGFGFETTWLQIVLWLLTPIVVIILFLFFYALYYAVENNYGGFSFLVPLFCALLGIYGTLFWRSDGIESMGTLSATGDGFISGLTVFLTVVFYLLLLVGIVTIFLTSSNIFVGLLRLILLPILCVLGFVTGIVGTLVLIVCLFLFGGIIGHFVGGGNKDNKIQDEYGDEYEWSGSKKSWIDKYGKRYDYNHEDRTLTPRN